MSGFETVAKASEIPPGEMTLVEFEGEEVVIANVDGEFFAFGNICTHSGGPLVEGELDGQSIICPWHSTVFDVATGEPESGPADDAIPTYEVRVEGDEIGIRKP
jgi:nitrite reductase/ring-hydroxylating ferredoxin subunit